MTQQRMQVAFQKILEVVAATQLLEFTRFTSTKVQLYTG